MGLAWICLSWFFFHWLSWLQSSRFLSGPQQSSLYFNLKPPSSLGGAWTCIPLPVPQRLAPAPLISCTPPHFACQPALVWPKEKASNLRGLRSLYFSSLYPFWLVQSSTGYRVYFLRLIGADHYREFDHLASPSFFFKFCHQLMVALFPLNRLEDHSYTSQGSPCLSWYACKQQTYTIFGCFFLSLTNSPSGFPILSSFFERKARPCLVAIGSCWIQAQLLSSNLRHF